MLTQKMDELKGAPVEQTENVEDVNYVHNGGQNRNFNNNYRSNQGGGGYNNNKNNPNMSYGNLNNALTPPQGFSVSKGGVIEEPKNQSQVQEELLRAILARGDRYMAEQAVTSKRVTQVETIVGGLATQMKLFETQMGRSNGSTCEQSPSAWSLSEPTKGESKGLQGDPTENWDDFSRIHH